MRRVAVLSPLIAVALAGPVAVVAAQERPPLRALLEQCTTGATADERAAGFEGSMPARPRARRMAMRFDLQQRQGMRGPWRIVRDVPGFGEWERSETHRAGFVFHKHVDGLVDSTERSIYYRALVRFRWYDDEGDVVRRTARRTAHCRQPRAD